MNGFLLINKEKGPTSHDIIYKSRKILKTKKIGHTGTLDPLASGLMVICVGTATKAADFLTSGDKAYIADMELGFVSDTLDNTGSVTPLPQKSFSSAEIESAVHSFLGEINQMPPMYSAKKINGKKLYEYARQGVEIERKPEKITIKELKIISIDNNKKVKFYVLCSKGTYIRSLIDDIGKKLDYGAIMTDLKRVKSGNFSFETHTAYTLDELSEMSDFDNIFYPLDTAFSGYKRLNVNKIVERFIRNGIAVNLHKTDIKNEYNDGEIIAVYNENDVFFALLEAKNGHYLKLRKSFFAQE